MVRQAALVVAVLLSATGCARTKRETVLATDALKVVAVTRSRLDITVSAYRHATTYDLYVNGEPLSDTGFARMLGVPERAGGRFVHHAAVPLGQRDVLLESHEEESERCWATRLSADGGRVVLEKIVESTIDCSPRPGPPGWQVLHDAASNVLLVRQQPFRVYPLAGYASVLWIEEDVVALYAEARDTQQLKLRLVRISTGAALAELALPKSRYAEPRLLDLPPEARRQWLQENFTVAMAAPFSITLRTDNTLQTITPEVWATYQQIERENTEADARARAAGEARDAAQRRELQEAEAARNRATR